MAKRTVVWSLTVSKQRRDILKYWTIRNGTTLYAEKLIKLIKERIGIISKKSNSIQINNF